MKRSTKWTVIVRRHRRRPARALPNRSLDRESAADMVPGAANAGASAAGHRVVKTRGGAKKPTRRGALQNAVHDEYVDRPKGAVPERARNAAHDFEAVFLP